MTGWDFQGIQWCFMSLRDNKPIEFISLQPDPPFKTLTLRIYDRWRFYLFNTKQLDENEQFRRIQISKHCIGEISRWQVKLFSFHSCAEIFYWNWSSVIEDEVHSWLGDNRTCIWIFYEVNPYPMQILFYEYTLWFKWSILKIIFRFKISHFFRKKKLTINEKRKCTNNVLKFLSDKYECLKWG